MLVQWARMDGHRFRPSSLSDYQGGITDARDFLESGGSFVLTSDRHSSEHSLWPTRPPPPSPLSATTTTRVREFTVTGHLEGVLKDSFAFRYRKARSFVTWIPK